MVPEGAPSGSAASASPTSVDGLDVAGALLGFVGLVTDSLKLRIPVSPSYDCSWRGSWPGVW